MKNLNRYTIMPIFIALIHVIGCAHTPPPKGWLPSVAAAQHESYGGWISIICRTGDAESKVYGELIAIHSNQIFVLTTQELTSISTDSISHMILTTTQLSGNSDVDSYRQMMYPTTSLEEFRAYARFPQGLSKDIDNQSLKPKRPRAKISVSTKASKSPKNPRK